MKPHKLELELYTLINTVKRAGLLPRMCESINLEGGGGQLRFFPFLSG